MDKVDQAINALLALFASAADAVIAGLAAIEQWLRAELTTLGVAPQIQTVIMIAVAVVLLLVVLRVFGGVIRVILVVFLILLALHVVLPIAHARPPGESHAAANAKGRSRPASPFADRLVRARSDAALAHLAAGAAGAKDCPCLAAARLISLS